MGTKIQCPKCQRQLTVPDNPPAAQGRCPACGQPIQLAVPASPIPPMLPPATLPVAARAGGLNQSASRVIDAIGKTPSVPDTKAESSSNILRRRRWILAGSAVMILIVIAGVALLNYPNEQRALANNIADAIEKSAQQSFGVFPANLRSALRGECLAWVQNLPEADFRRIVAEEETAKPILLQCAEYVHRPGSPFTRALTGNEEILDKQADRVTGFVIDLVESNGGGKSAPPAVKALQKDTRAWIRTLPERDRLVMVWFRDQDRPRFDQLVEQLRMYTKNPESALAKAQPEIAAWQAVNALGALVTAANVQQQPTPPPQQQPNDFRQAMDQLSKPRPCTACGGSGSYSFVDGAGQLQLKTCPYCRGMGGEGGRLLNMQPFRRP